MPPAYDEEEEGMAPLEKGRHRYQKKNYQRALVAFSEAVNISTDHILLTALNHRAATFEKLDMLQSALKDAKEMIELKPELSKGYLRCGKVLQLKGENKLALKIYERGLNKVKIGANTDKDRVTLQSMFNKLQKSQAPSKTLDPLSYLPLEIAEMIVAHLGIQERMACLSVSKSWKQVLESCPKLWITLDTTFTGKLLPQRALNAYLQRSKYRLHEAILKQPKVDTKLQYLTKTCKKLQRLTICDNGVIGDSLTSALPLAKSLRYLKIAFTCEISFSHVLEALQHVQETITEAEFWNVHHHLLPNPKPWPKLEKLKVLRVEKYPGRTIPMNNLIESIPNIQSLKLRDFYLRASTRLDLSELHSLESLALVDCGMVMIPLLPSTLKHLCLNDNVHLINQETDRLDLPLLENFSCEKTGITDELIFATAKQALKLKDLYMGARVVEGNTIARCEFPLCKSIENLGLRLTRYKEESIMRITGQCPNLKSVDLHGTRVTGVAVKHLVKQGVTRLELQGCDGVSSDAVEYARGKDVEVFLSDRDIGRAREIARNRRGPRANGFSLFQVEW